MCLLFTQTSFYFNLFTFILAITTIHFSFPNRYTEYFHNRLLLLLLILLCQQRTHFTSAYHSISVYLLPVFEECHGKCLENNFTVSCAYVCIYTYQCNVLTDNNNLPDRIFRMNSPQNVLTILVNFAYSIFYRIPEFLFEWILYKQCT